MNVKKNPIAALFRIKVLKKLRNESHMETKMSPLFTVTQQILEDAAFVWGRCSTDPKGDSSTGFWPAWEPGRFLV